MTHLYIEQNTGWTEEVNASIISKLYELASSGDLDNTSDLKGRLHSNLAYQNEVDYLNSNFNELYISADQMYIKFEDPVVERICATNWGDGTGITIAQAAAVTRQQIGNTFYNNTSITKFNEFKYFTGVLQSGYSGENWFSGCTSLTEITIPKQLQSMRCNNSGTFDNCTSLQYIHYDNPSSMLYVPCMYNCTSLRSPLIFPNSVEGLLSDSIRTSSGGTLSNIHTMVFGANLNAIYNTSGGNGQSYPLDIIIYRSTPPTLYLDSWNWTNNVITFYVPDSAVNDYKTTWSSKVTNNIKPISEYSGTEWDTSLAASMYGYDPSNT